MNRNLFMLSGLFAGALLLILATPGKAALPSSLVTIDADSEAKMVLEGDTVYFQITLDNTNGDFLQGVYLNATFLSETAWSTGFVNETDGTPLPEVQDPEGIRVEPAVEVPKGQTRAFYFWVQAPADGHLLPPARIQVTGIDNWGRIAKSANATMKANREPLNLTITAQKEYAVMVSLDPVGKKGGNKLEPNKGTAWGYTLENQGWRSETYTLSGAVYKAGGGIPQTGWSFTFSGGTTISLAGGESPQGTHFKKNKFTITPPADATDGYYDLAIRAISGNATTVDYVEAKIGLPDLAIGQVKWTRQVLISYRHQSQIQVHIELLNKGIETNSPFKIGFKDSGFTKVGPAIDMEWDRANGSWVILSDTPEASFQTVKGKTYLTFYLEPSELNLEVQNMDSSTQYIFYIAVDRDRKIKESNEGNNEKYISIAAVRESLTILARESIIEEVSTFKATAGQTITFKGKQPIASQATYRWESNRDGPLGNELTLTLDSLSPGVHNITFSVDSVYGYQIGYEIVFPDDRTPLSSLYDVPMQLTGEKVDSTTYRVQVLKITDPISLSNPYDLNYILFDPQGDIVASASVVELYGAYEGQGKGVIFADNDYNGKLSNGDWFILHVGEAGDPALENLTSLDGYSFKLAIGGQSSEMVSVEITGAGGSAGDDDNGVPDLKGLRVPIGLILLIAVVLAGSGGGLLVWKKRNSPLRPASYTTPLPQTPPAQRGIETRLPPLASAPAPPPRSSVPSQATERPQPLSSAPSQPPPTATIECPGCKARMEIPKLGRLQNVRCEACGLEGSVKI